MRFISSVVVSWRLMMLAFAALVSIGVVFAEAEGSRASEPTTETLTFRAWIDGSDYVHIQGNEIWMEHRNFQYQGLWESAGGEACPADMSPYIWPAGDEHREVLLNGAVWIPEWPDDCGYDDPGQASLNSYEKLALPESFAPTDATLNVVSIGDLGRQDANLSSITITQQPAAENGYETIVLLDDDPGFFAAYFEFTLKLTEPKPVGGLSADPGVAPLDSGSATPWLALAGFVAAFALAAGGWYAGRRLRIEP